MAHVAIRPGAAPTISPCRTPASRTDWILRHCRTAKQQARRQSSRRMLYKIGRIHTYLELYARLLGGPTQQVALVVADKADREGNLYKASQQRGTKPKINSKTAPRFRGGQSSSRSNEIVDHLPRSKYSDDMVSIRHTEPEGLT